MEKFQEAREKAHRNLQIADHMIYMTYGLVQDPKLLMAVMENLFLALTNGMSSVLHYERLFKRIGPFQENFEAKFRLFKDKCSKRYNIDNKYMTLIREVKDIIVEHRRSPVEFVRKDRFVICGENYRMKTISVDKIKEYVGITKAFLAEANNIVSKDERIFLPRNRGIQAG